MADNVNITAGVGTPIATDDIGGVQYQRVKVAHGADGSATDVSTVSPMPAQLRDSDGTDVALSGKLGAVDETAPATDTASSGLNGRLQRIAQRLSSIIALLPTALGAGGGLKVDGSGTALPVSASSLPLPSGAATAAKQPALGTAGTPSADVISVQGVASGTAVPVSAASLPLPSGAATETTLGTMLTQADFDTKVGSLTETAPASDTASSGLNGRLQRIAQRITSLIALVPTSLGTKTATNSFAVTLASDDTLVATVSSGRVAVNPISGQAGVAAGNGAVSATTQRVAIADMSAGEYETVAASQTAQVLGATGAAGDFIGGLLIIPATTSPGNVLLLDNATSITIFAGGSSSVSNLVPFFVPLGMISVSGAWKVTTGANVSVIGIGNFT